MDLPAVMGDKFLEECGVNPDEEVFTEDDRTDC